MLTRWQWLSVGFAAGGAVLVNLIYGCIWYAIPDRPIARDWYVYWLLLFGPYLLAAAGSWVAARVAGLRAKVAAANALVLVIGVVILGIVFADTFTVFWGDAPPAIPISAILSGLLLTVQYGLAAATCFTQVVARLDRRGPKPQEPLETNTQPPQAT
jgi:CHASE2 domain-containing sensor protein